MSIATREVEFAKFVIAREDVRIKKERGDARPYSKDPILNAYHFCNVRRADDRVTKWIGQWVKRSTAKDRWFWCAVARWINQPDTLTMLTPAMPTFNMNWDLNKALKILGQIDASGGNIFRGAYIITGAMTNRKRDGRKKYETILIEVLDKVWQNKPMIDKRSLEQSWLALRKNRGMGPFMAGQIVADWQTFGVINAVDVNTWAPLGPGSKRGLRYIYDRDLNQRDAVTYMQELHQDVLMDRCPALAETLTLHDVQNCLCEFSKYKRGWAKSRYVPYEEKP